MCNMNVFLPAGVGGTVGKGIWIQAFFVGVALFVDASAPTLSASLSFSASAVPVGIVDTGLGRTGTSASVAVMLVGAVVITGATALVDGAGMEVFELPISLVEETSGSGDVARAESPGVAAGTSWGLSAALETLVVRVVAPACAAGSSEGFSPIAISKGGDPDRVESARSISCALLLLPVVPALLLVCALPLLPVVAVLSVVCVLLLLLVVVVLSFVLVVANNGEPIAV